MTMAVSLPDAAVLTADNLYTLWVANTLKAKSGLFWSTLQATFPEQEIKSHPCSNWITLIAALSDSMPAASVSIASLNTLVSYVYSLCFLASQLSTQVPAQISAGQATAVLTAYNAQFG